MGKAKFKTNGLGVMWLPDGNEADTGVVLVRVRYRSGTRIRLSAWTPGFYRRGTAIPLGDFLRGLGVTAEECAAAIAETERKGAAS